MTVALRRRRKSLKSRILKKGALMSRYLLLNPSNNSPRPPNRKHRKAQKNSMGPKLRV